MNYQARTDKLRAKLRRRKIDALLISQPENRRFLCGFPDGDHGISETSGLLLVPASGRKKVQFLTDFRYKTQAETELPWAEIHIYRQGLLKLLEEILPELDIKCLGFESHYTLHSFAANLSETLGRKGITTRGLEDLVESDREIKDVDEIAAIRRSVRLNEEVFLDVYKDFSAFETEIDVALAIETLMRQKGAERPSFSTIVASGERGALPHAVPGRNPIHANQSLTIDMGLVLDGYCSDMTRTFVPGHPDDTYRKIHSVVRQAQLAGMAAVRAGVRACDVDKAARKIIVEAGYGQYFGHSLGHGVGLAIHEEPRVSSRNKRKLKTGMIITVEPGIYIPGWGGIRLENMMVVREDGGENLNSDATWLDI